MHDGIKWIWKTSKELAERLGCSEKTVRRHLKHLVDLGWLKREQLQKRWGMRAYHYSLGDDAPLKAGVIARSVEHLHGMKEVRNTGGRPASQMPVQTRRLVSSEPDTMTASINRNTTSTNSPPGQNSRNSQGASRQTEQFHQVARQASESNGEGGIRTHGVASEEQGGKTLEKPMTPMIVSRNDLYSEPALAFKTRAKNDRTTSSLDAPLVPETSATNTAVPSHWPEDQMSLSLKIQLIEAARQMAFPGRSHGFA